MFGVTGQLNALSSFADVPSWLYWVAGIGMFLLLARRHAERSRPAAMQVADGSFAMVAGCEEAVEDLRELVDFLKDPSRFAKFGAKVPKGALLVGPPGTGKTLLARTVAAEAGVPFLSASGSDFVEMFVGVGAKRIRELYEEARTHERAIVFIDEIDAVARRRSGAGSGQTFQPAAVEHENTLIALLTELDGFAESRVITLAATNRPDVLDPAVTRPGRLDRRIEVPAPDRRGREAILAVHVSGKPLGTDVDLAVVAARTPGLSGADLARVVNEAALCAVRRDLEVIDGSCFDDAVELVALGRPRTSALVTERDRRVVAWHEAGHALCALLLEHVPDPVAVTIVPRGDAGGVTWMGSTDDRLTTRDEAEERLVVMLGGRVAEELLLGGGCTQGAASDLVQATELASAMVARLGFSDLGVMVRERLDDDATATVDALLARAHGRARELLSEHRGALESVAAGLLERERLSGGELRAVAAVVRESAVPMPFRPTSATMSTPDVREGPVHQRVARQDSGRRPSVRWSRIAQMPGGVLRVLRRRLRTRLWS
jgi:cell division protease FtsH